MNPASAAPECDRGHGSEQQLKGKVAADGYVEDENVDSFRQREPRRVA